MLPAIVDVPPLPVFIQTHCNDVEAIRNNIDKLMSALTEARGWLDKANTDPWVRVLMADHALLKGQWDVEYLKPKIPRGTNPRE